LSARPPPTSALFPYTTLFRSDVRDLHAGLVQAAPDHRLHPLTPARASAGVALSWCQTRHEEGSRLSAARVTASGTRRREERRGRDRKSTRLNSSHVATSYAVF